MALIRYRFLRRGVRVPQVTIYIDRETDAQARRAARAAGLSYSRWITEAVQQRARTEWPPSIRDLAGSDGEFPLTTELRRGQGRDRRRVALRRA
jgi:hypothetical protein